MSVQNSLRHFVIKWKRTMWVVSARGWRSREVFLVGEASVYRSVDPVDKILFGWRG